jgi:F-type H+-transporting ATPase subunit delta
MKGGKEAQKHARQLFRLCLEKGVLDEARVLKTVKALIKDKPRGYLAILDAFHRLVRLEVEKGRAKVESAEELSETTSDLVKSNLKKAYRRDLDIEFSVDPDLIAGLRVRVGSDVWDGTVRSRIERLRQELTR